MLAAALVLVEAIGVLLEFMACRELLVDTPSPGPLSLDVPSPLPTAELPLCS